MQACWMLDKEPLMHARWMLEVEKDQEEGQEDAEKDAEEASKGCSFLRLSGEDYLMQEQSCPHRQEPMMQARRRFLRLSPAFFRSIIKYNNSLVLTDRIR